MTKKPWIKLIKLDIKLDTLALRSYQIREPFNEMMKRKRERYSLLLGMENISRKHGVDSELVKKELKELEKFIEYYSEALSSWDSSVDQRDEFYQRWSLEKVSEIDIKEEKQAFLNQFPDIKEIFNTLKNIIAIQQKIIVQLEGSVKVDEVVRT